MGNDKRVLGLLNSMALYPSTEGPDFYLGIRKTNPVYGAGITAPLFTKRLILHGTMNRYEMFSSPRRVTVITQDVKKALLRTKRSNLVRVHEYRELLDGFDNLGITLWFDSDAKFWEAAYIRSRWSSKLYPITAIFHTISYQNMLHGFVLPLLLAESWPCDSILCFSQAARRALLTMLEHVSTRFRDDYNTSLSYRGRLDVIPLGVDTDVFRPRNKSTVRRQLGLPIEACIILYLGRFSFIDKMDLFPTFRVVRDLMMKHVGRNVLLVLGGSSRGTYLDSVKRHLSEMDILPQVRIMAAPPEDRHLLFSAADIFISPSDNVQENLGSTPIEAMASGVPQVVADWNGYRETVRHGETGFLVPVRWIGCDADLRDLAPLHGANFEFDHGSMAQSVAMDLRQYARCLESLIMDKALRVDMARASRRRALANYSWQSVVRQYEELGSELAKIASGVTYTPRRTPVYTCPPYFQSFGHYATDCLGDDTIIRLSSTTRNPVDRFGVIPPYHPALEYRILDANILSAVMDEVRQRRSRCSRPLGKMSAPAQTAAAMGAVVHNLVRILSRHPDEIRRHIMWLLKNGLLEVQGAEDCD